MQSFSSFKRRYAALLLTALTCAVLAACRGEKVIDQNSREYAEVVRAFYVGLSALQVGDDVRAEAKLKEATTLAPDEPAAWANLGLLYLRQRDFERAAENLEKARGLASDSAPVQVMMGLLESSRGRYAEAVAAFRRAVELNPRDLKALYALASEVEREGGESAEPEVARLLGRILEAQPDNLAVQLDLARLAAKRGDADVLRGVVLQLARRSASWPPEAQEQFKALQAAAASDNPRAAAPRVAFLRNVLVRVPEYRQSLAAVKLPSDVIGEPLTRTLRLEPPSPRPAPPDEGLTFGVESLSEFPEDGWGLVSAVHLGGEGAPVLLAARANSPVPSDVPTPPGYRFAAGLYLGGTSRRLDTPGNVLSFAAFGRAGRGLAALDFDYDFKVDLAAAGYEGFKLYRQGDGGAFADVTAATRLPNEVLAASYAGAWAADLEADGDLDLVLARRKPDALVALQNNGDGTLTPVTPFGHLARAVNDFHWGDVDGDGDGDVLVRSTGGALDFFDNERGGQFRARPLPTDIGEIRATALADVNDDGRLDIVAARGDGSVVRVSDKSEGEGWESARLSPALGAPLLDISSPTLFVADLDNNGGLDLLLSGLQSTPSVRVLLNDGSGSFKPPAAQPAVGGKVDAVADLDGDGLLDLVGTTHDGQAIRARAKGTKNYHWQVIRPRAQEATGDQRINSFGVGGEIEIRAGLLVQKQPIASPVVHFGLGEQTQTDVARIAWPNGVLQAEFELKADQPALAEQRLKGSCPWVFAWDGERVGFVTDFIWRSPLGLKINAQDTAGVAMTEEWVKIRGDQLAPREGFYDVRITAELWESHFFDHVSLMAVDHPAGTEVFVDERFAVPPPPLEVYATRAPQAFAGAWDDEGRDVSEIVSQTDGRYLDNFGRGRYQGVTREHFVEAELPADASAGGPLWLVASGWIHPTDSSINVAISQGGQPKPQGLSLEVPDGRGGWRVARPALGFPAGKTKTVVIDLKDVFTPGAPRRLRLRTNLEIFWDRLAWAVAAPSSELKTTRIEAASAELRFRGYSVVAQADKSSPELPRYERLAGVAPIWRDLVGYHTRFGDVRELLKTVDDRYVIMNAGDELALRFPALAPPAAGWVRDFVLVGDGWEKDGDYNTGFSKTVLPLPTHASPDYTKPPTRLEDDPVYRRHARDWQDYHTRYVTPRDFSEALRLR